MITGMALVTTAEAAKQLGVADGLVTPDLITPGGHQRWDVDRLRAQLRELQDRDES